jgi:hypothetical protein
LFVITGNRILRNAKWSTKDDKPAQGNYAIFPLCESDERNNLRFIGTAFFICTNGVFVTAKHVVMDQRGEQPIDPLTAIQFIDGNRCVLRPVLSLSTNSSDVVIGVLAPDTAPQLVIIQPGEASLMSCRKIYRWLTAFQAFDDRNTKVSVGLKTDTQERASCISSSLR